ncbi:MAG: hypothetical protein HN350_16300 [Phycisphaerales bacterium]|nr:hypothetical protein [Phycisphaerales bacterium]
MKRIALSMFCLGLWSAFAMAERPPYTDYCAMLSQEIQGRKHAFLAGNLTYYVGGRFDVWTHRGDETIGLTQPFFHDLRGRGFGLVKHDKSGYGHDFRGWEFYNQTKVMFGTVIVGGKEYKYPAPISMKWRPDKVVCTYEVGGVNVREEKFIAANDTACTIITSDKPVTLRFDGQSLVIAGKSIDRTSKVRLDAAGNSVHITEGGTVQTHPFRDKAKTLKAYPGKLIYDGMSTVLSSSAKLSAYTAARDKEGRQVYSFEVPCDSKGVAMTWAMHDDYAKALKATKTVLGDYRGALAAKTKASNDMLNYQVPYFRCSDRDIVSVYYYLWAIHLMYYIDVQKGWEMYPHTQSAVNNFLGMHRYDANFQIKVGSWAADKKRYAYGNVLNWKAILPYARRGGLLPDNKGIAWISPVWGTTTEHVIGAWEIYQRTGDLQFIRDCYTGYFDELFKNGMAGHWGCNYDAARYLREMAILTGDKKDPDRWLKMVRHDRREIWRKQMWEAHYPKFFGGARGRLDWSGFAYLRNSGFPEKWAYDMTKAWAMDSKKGFFWKTPLSTMAFQHFDQVCKDFTSTPDTNYYAIYGMYKCNVGRNANICALAHLKGYNMHWGIPIAPEAWSLKALPWGDQYSNFNAGKILLIIEGIAGLDYSIPNGTLTIRDSMPEEWSSMELRVPMTVKGKMHWPIVKYARKKTGDTVAKTISVTGNPLANLKVKPWLEEGAVLSAPQGYSAKGQGRNRIGYSFKDAVNKSVTIKIKPGEKE